MHAFLYCESHELAKLSVILEFCGLLGHLHGKGELGAST